MLTAPENKKHTSLEINCMIKSKNSHFTKINDGFSQILTEAEEAFAAEGIQMLGEGIREILTEDVYFDSYVERLTQGLDAGDEEVVRGLCENTRDHILSESGLTGIVPLSALSMPTLRKSWPRLAITKAIPTEATETPKFKVTFFEPWIMNSAGVKLALPAALHDVTADLANRKPVVTSVLVADLAAGADIIPPAEKAPNGAWKHGASVDTDLRLSGKLVMTAAEFKKIPGLSGNAVATDVALKLVGLVDLNGGQHVGEGLKLDTRTSMISGKFGLALDGTAVTLTAPEQTALEAYRLSLFIKANLATGILEGAVLGGVAVVKSLGIIGSISTEMNTYTQDVGFDIQDKEVVVPTAAHLSASLPTEYLMDLMRTYQIDGVAKVVDIMSDVLAQRVDLEGVDFLKNQFVASGARYETEFNVTPIA